jgi:hypothetical protein
VKLVNDFAAVEVELDNRANGVRLKIVDLTRNSHAVYLDPVHLEALVWADPAELDRLTDPDHILRRLDADGPTDRAEGAR